jgi:hypothetical protein
MNVTLAKTIFGPYAPQDPPCFRQGRLLTACRVYRRPLEVIHQLAGLTLHVLILKSEGHKFPRNPNAHILELYCGTYFFGPMVVAMNSVTKPYALESFTHTELAFIKEDNQRVHRIYPPPYDGSYPTMSLGTEDSALDATASCKRDVKGVAKHETAQYDDRFYMYRYKTAYCPNIAVKHDWTLCIYAHRFTDYRRRPDQFQYYPEECTQLNMETWVIVCKRHRGECRDGDDCRYSHSTAERLYHPMKYKTSPCDVPLLADV